MSLFDFKFFFCFDVLGVELPHGSRDGVPDLEGRVLGDGVTVVGGHVMVLGDVVSVLVGRELVDEGRMAGLPHVEGLVDGGRVRMVGANAVGGCVLPVAVTIIGGWVLRDGVVDSG